MGLPRPSPVRAREVRPIPASVRPRSDRWNVHVTPIGYTRSAHSWALFIIIAQVSKNRNRLTVLHIYGKRSSPVRNSADSTGPSAAPASYLHNTMVISNPQCPGPILIRA